MLQDSSRGEERKQDVLRLCFAAPWLLLLLVTSAHASEVRFALDEAPFRTIQIDDVHGILTILPDQDASGHALVISGPADRVADIGFDQFGQVLVIRPRGEIDRSYDFRGLDPASVATIMLTVPRRVEVALTNFSGQARIGDTLGRISIQGGRSEIDVGEVEELNIDRWGSGYVSVDRVMLTADITTKGSARIHVGDVPDARVVHVGSGRMSFGRISANLVYNGAGSGDLIIDQISGAVSLETNGTGTVHIKSGIADPFYAVLNGEGLLQVDGTLVDPVLRHDNQGRIEIRKVDGLRQDRPTQAKFPLQWDETIGQE